MLIQPKKKKFLYTTKTHAHGQTIALFKTGSHWKTFQFQLDKL